jgi:hypothetical protein
VPGRDIRLRAEHSAVLCAGHPLDVLEQRAADAPAPVLRVHRNGEVEAVRVVRQGQCYVEVSGNGAVANGGPGQAPLIALVAEACADLVQ